MKITYPVHFIMIDNEKGLATRWLRGELSKEGMLRALKLNSDLQSQSGWEYTVSL